VKKSKIIFCALCSVVIPTGLHAVAIDDAAHGFLRDLAEEPEVSTILQRTAISPYSTESRIEKIEQGLDQLRNSLLDSGGEIKIVESWVTDPLGAVIASAGDPHIPESIRMFSLAMVKRNDHWLAGPWAGSFLNTNLGFDPQTRAQARELESWMSLRSAELLKNVRDQAHESFFKSVREEETYVLKHIKSARDVFDRFLNLCRQRNLAGAAYYLDPFLLEEGELSSSFAKSQIPRFRSKELNDGWHFLLEERCEIFPVAGIESEDETNFILGMFDPFGDTRVLFQQVGITSDNLGNGKRKWDIHLEAFDEEDMDRFESLHLEHEEYEEAFLKIICERYPSEPFQKSSNLTTGLQRSLKNRNFSDFISMWGDFPTMNTFESARFIWRVLLKEENRSEHFLEVGDIGALVVSGKLAMWAERSEGSWAFCSRWPEVKGGGLFSKERLARVALRSKVARLQAEMRGELLPDDVPAIDLLEKSAKLESLEDETAGEFVLAWLDALESRDFEGLNKGSIRLFDAQKFPKILNARKRGAEILSSNQELVLTEGDWSVVAVSVSRKTREAGNVYFTYVTKVNGAPKVLVDLDLEMPRNRGRELLNEAEILELEEKVDAETHKILKSLYKKALAGMKKNRQAADNALEFVK